jgi:prepilin-type N-terminal cleavage/methylation domain-containing protein
MPLLRKKLQGFTLIEVLVSLFVFVIILTATSQIFSQAFFGYRSTKSVQRDVENAQYSLNTMAKELRTSSIVNPASGPVSSQSVKFYDHSQGICFQYRISSSMLQVARVAVASATDCAAAGLGSFTTISTGVISGRFIVTPSSIAPVQVGKITVSLEISEGPTHTARIQTSASLRDYGHIGL